MTPQSAQANGPYWWCLVHRCVEGQVGCGHKDRLGPYPTEARAADALAAAHERSEVWDDADEMWTQ